MPNTPPQRAKWGMRLTDEMADDPAGVRALFAEQVGREGWVIDGDVTIERIENRFHFETDPPPLNYRAFCYCVKPGAEQYARVLDALG